MRCFPFLVLLLLLRFQGLSQIEISTLDRKKRTIDSLYQAMSNASPTQRVDIFNELSISYDGIQRDSSRSFTTKAYKEALAMNYYKGQSSALCMLAYFEYAKNNFEAAKKYVVQAIDAARKSEDREQLGRAHKELGLVYMGANEYTEAIRELETAGNILEKEKKLESLIDVYVQKSSAYMKMNRLYDALKTLNAAAAISKKSSNKNEYAATLESIGLIYYTLKEYNTTIAYYKQSIDTRTSYNWWNLGKTLNRLGNVYTDIKQYDSALYYYKKCLALIEQDVIDTASKLHRISGLHADMGKMYLHSGNLDKALSLLQPSHQYFKSKGNVNTLPMMLPSLGKAFLAKKDYKTALEYGRELLWVSEKIKSGKNYIKAYDVLALAYEGLNRPDSAYHYVKLSTAIKDSIDAENFKSNASFYKAMLENEEGESKLQLLHKDTQLKQQKLNFIIVGLILLILLALVFLRYLNSKRKTERHRRAIIENELQIQKLEADKQQSFLKQHTTELEMQILRAQMSPHFVFNCLNAINHFILNNETEIASDYLTKFSRLIRLVLQNSAKNTISLADELASLQLYIELEQVRFKNHFWFLINVDEDVDTEGLQIPPLLLQPFVENAIWHGLMHKEGDGVLQVAITVKDGLLRCTITDNGIGRQNEKAKNNPLSKKKSMGLLITGNRLKMMESEKGTGSFAIIDLKDEEGNNQGTKIIVSIPTAISETVAA